MTKKRFTFADAKERIKVLEDANKELKAELADLYDKTADDDSGFKAGVQMGAGAVFGLFAIYGIIVYLLG